MANSSDLPLSHQPITHENVRDSMAGGRSLLKVIKTEQG